MCSITSHDTQQHKYVDDAISAGSREIPNNSTTEALKSLCATIKFIHCWLKHLQQTQQEISEMYHEVTIDLFKQIPTMKYNPLSQDKNNQFLLIDIGGS